MNARNSRRVHDSAWRQDHLAWCRAIFHNLADGGLWGVPRSGLLFRREGSALVLHDRMPWAPEIPMSARELREYQDADFEVIRAHFGAAGILVAREGEIRRESIFDARRGNDNCGRG